MGRVQGKVAIVTGAAAGMGRSHARLLAAEGALVVAADIDEAGVRATTEEILQGGGQALAAILDVRNEAHWVSAFERAENAFGPVDTLVNNAGVIGYGNLADTTLAEWNRVFDINVTGTFLGCREAARRMQARGGSIINISSSLGLVGVAGAASYVASKGAITLLTKALAAEGAASGIRVNSIHPGLVDTPMIAAFINDSRAVDALLGPTLLRRPAQPIEISRVVLFLASDEASYMTGSALAVDGGYTAV